jgi:hypothetical protein
VYFHTKLDEFGTLHCKKLLKFMSKFTHFLSKLHLYYKNSSKFSHKFAEFYSRFSVAACGCIIFRGGARPLSMGGGGEV